MAEGTAKQAGPDKALVGEIAYGILSGENIAKSIKTAKTDTPEKEIALEFVRSYAEFLDEIVENDINRNLTRADFEIRDLVSNVNSMLREKDEFIFSTMVFNCPIHYRSLQQTHLKKSVQEES